MEGTMGEYLIRFHGSNGAADCAEVADTVLGAVLRIEEFTEYGCELSYVLHVELIDGRRVARDVTDDLRAQLHERETERLTEKFHEGDHSFHSLAGYLEMADRHFPERA